MENAIELKNINKTFRYFKKDYMVFYWLFTKKGYTKEFKVLKNINVSIKKGEVVGILGKNGAGKSTILKIISGIYFPSSGQIKVNGTIASLIELGAGFNRELTGRENIYLKGSLLGLSKQYINDHIDDMIDFADIGEYIDMPLGTYSSGMAARIGFALAVNADPDILILDEIFAVGDKNFQKKSRAKTEELLKSGKTVLFVSHSESLITEFCDRVIYLKNGDIVFDGEVKQGLATYHADNLNLKKEPILSFVEYDLSDDQIRLRFEVGIGAGNQFICADKIDNFEFIPSRYSIKDKSSSEEGIFSFEVEKIDENTVDLVIENREIIDGGYFTFNFKHCTNSENKTACYAEQETEDESDDYIFKVRNIDENFAFELLRSKK